MRKLMLAIAAAGAMAAAVVAETAGGPAEPAVFVLDFALDTGAVPVEVEPVDGLEARYCVDTAFTGFEFNSDGLFHGGMIIIR